MHMPNPARSALAREIALTVGTLLLVAPFLAIAVLALVVGH